MGLRPDEIKNLNDEALLKVYSEDASSVLNELYRRYSVLCYGLSLKYLNGREEAKDAVSEIFLKLHSDLFNYRIQNFRSWFYVYTKNYCFTILRKRARNRELREEFHVESINLSYDAERDKLSEQIRMNLPELKTHHRKCLELFYFQNKSYGEIAHFLDLPVNKVKSYLQNAKRKLRILVEDRLNSEFPLSESE